MKVLIQRTSSASVTVDGVKLAEIGRGFLVLLGVRVGDGEEDAIYLAGKTAALRVFPDADGRMNLSLAQVGGQALIVSQFTLYADTRRGNRPGFGLAASPNEAEKLYQDYVVALRAKLGEANVFAGRFQTEMEVALVNDGPVTIELISRGEQVR